MNYQDYFKKLEDDLEYQEAEQELKVTLDLADDILRLRMKKGWSQTELAERAGTKHANISRLESGLINPSVKFLQKVARALNTSIFIHFEQPSPKFDLSTKAEYQSQEAIPLPSNWPGIKSQITTHTSSGTSSASIRRIHD
ncbi:MAG: helix-turn-helix transcriptional regulator [Anaerolineales bacterium]